MTVDGINPDSSTMVFGDAMHGDAGNSAFPPDTWTIGNADGPNLVSVPVEGVAIWVVAFGALRFDAESDSNMIRSQCKLHLSE